MKFCSKCRTENNDDAVYCNKCGEQFSLIPRQTSEYPYKPIYPASVESCEIRKKTSKMAITGIIISVAIMSLLIISIFVPWYNVDVKLDGNYQVSGSSFSLNTDYKIFFSLSEGGYEIEATKVVDGISEDYKDSDKRGYTSGTDKDEGLNNLMNITYFLTLCKREIPKL